MIKKYALVSVSDKTNIDVFAKQIQSSGYTIISTGGTYQFLLDHGISATPVDEITGNPRDSFDGRMKTISFQIESGILYDRKNPKHLNQAKKLKIPQIDLVVCNLYPFEKSPSVENIDVGGPTMIRSAAKNYQNVLVVTDPSDYQKIGKKLKSGVIENERRQLASKAFYHLSFYDSQIGKYFSDNKYSKEFTIPLRKIQDLRYGENPHQKAALYSTPRNNSPMSKLAHHWGRELSGTNIGDISSGLEAVRMFKEPSAVIVKHHSPCGLAIGKDVEEALNRAVEADPVSAFGGIIVLNREMDLKTAKIVASFKNVYEGNIDIIAVPSISEDALELLKSLRKSMGIYTFGKIPSKRSERWDVKFFDGAVNLQDFDDRVERSFKNWKVVTKRKPTNKQLELMKFAWKAVRSIRSNAVIVVDKDTPMTRGIGAGQTSRVGATKIALEQAGKYCKEGLLASDSFFPFGDSVKLSAKYGISAIIEQGGSINDQDSVDEADKAGIAMVFTNTRAFRH